jgi:hypothetical protein
MSGANIGGIIGATIGFFVGGWNGAAIGYQLGSAYGSSFDSLPGVDGPRISDLKAQSSEYGRSIPIVYGSIGLGGNVIWAADLIEDKTVTTSGGKGSPKQSLTSYSYFADFAVLLAEGPCEVLRIWAGPERRLIYDANSIEGGTIRIYTGTESQLPDSLIESYLGVGNVPSYRGSCYIVFEKFPLANDGNRMPIIFAEVGRLGTDFPRVATYLGAGAGVTAYQPARAVYDPVNQNVWSINYSYPNLTVTVNSDITLAQVSTTTISITSAGSFDPTAVVFKPGSPNTIWISGGSSYDHFVCFNADDYSLISSFDGGYVGSARIYLGVYNPSANALLWARDGGTITIAAEAGGTTSFTVAGGATAGTAISYLVIGSTYIVGGIGPSGSISRIFVNRVDDYSAVNYFAATTNVGKVAWDEAYNTVAWSGSSGLSSVTVTVHNYLTAVEVTNTFGPVAAPKGDTSPGQSCYASSLNFAGGKFLLTCTGYSPRATTLFRLNRTTLAAEYGFTYAGEETASAFDKITVGNLTLPGKPYLIGFDQTNVKRIPFGGGAGGQSLAEVVSDLSDRAGLASSKYDVSALTDTVDGYAIAKQTSMRSAIDVLRPLYYFDAVESDGLVKFVKRGGSIAATVLDDDLAATSSDNTLDPLATTRKMEQELPRTVWVNYILAATNYQAATKYANRLIGSSGDETTIDAPLVLLDAKAQEIAQVNLTLAWVSRQTYRFNLPPRYAYLEPTDIVAVKGKTMRITKMVRTVAGVFECDAVADDSNFYAPTVIVTETPTSGQVVATLGPTTLLLA